MASDTAESALADRAAIRRLKHEYVRHLDAQDWDEWDGLFTVDAQMVDSPGRLDGHEAIVEHGRTSISPFHRYSMRSFRSNGASSMIVRGNTSQVVSTVSSDSGVMKYSE